MSQTEYMKLVDETGRAVRDDKPGAIDRALPSIVRRLGMSESTWIDQVRGTQSRDWRAIGLVESLVDKAVELKQRSLRGVAFARRLQTASRASM
ncbi:MAG TPA: hypothetical protein VM555_11735 [Tahibacter sp.]|nr:hypothetical protein [Tahibacter sp.]